MTRLGSEVFISGQHSGLQHWQKCDFGFLTVFIKNLLHIGGLAHIHTNLHVDCGIFIQYTVEIAGKSI